MCPGMMPILHCPGLIIPGQFGPISRDFDWVRKTCVTRTMSCCGIPKIELELHQSHSFGNICKTEGTTRSKSKQYNLQ